MGGGGGGIERVGALLGEVGACPSLQRAHGAPVLQQLERGVDGSLLDGLLRLARHLRPLVLREGGHHVLERARAVPHDQLGRVVHQLLEPRLRALPQQRAGPRQLVAQVLDGRAGVDQHALVLGMHAGQEAVLGAALEQRQLRLARQRVDGVRRQVGDQEERLPLQVDRLLREQIGQRERPARLADLGAHRHAVLAVAAPHQLAHDRQGLVARLLVSAGHHLHQEPHRLEADLLDLLLVPGLAGRVDLLPLHGHDPRHRCSRIPPTS